ncbi:MAG: hypothetical protein D6793_03000 [Thermoflexia bacterium]|nr:MAG: hypothetical protein D6793_03000 [Thermoflexia bacterium]
MDIDLNCDMGESFGAYVLGADEALMPLVTSVNIARGYHAGGPMVMDRTVRLALRCDPAGFLPRPQKRSDVAQAVMAACATSQRQRCPVARLQAFQELAYLVVPLAGLQQDRGPAALFLLYLNQDMASAARQAEAAISLLLHLQAKATGAEEGQGLLQNPLWRFAGLFAVSGHVRFPPAPSESPRCRAVPA